MKDAYDNFFKKYDIDTFFQDALNEIIYISNEKIDENWKSTIEKLTSNQELYIRGYGRDGAGTNNFIVLYKHLFLNDNIVKDATNNAKPTEIISKLTGLYKIEKKEIVEFERIQNYQISHLFGKTKNPLLFTAGWNIAYIPKYVDPFTGHETQGKYKVDFQNMFNSRNKERFAKYITEYNLFISNNVLPKLDEALKLTKKDLKLSANDFKKFEKNARLELSPII